MCLGILKILQNLLRRIEEKRLMVSLSCNNIEIIRSA